MTDDLSESSLHERRKDRTALKSGKYGLTLFFIYLALFAGFVGMAAFDYKAMAEPMLGVNVAVVYGMVLILAAIVLAFIYMFANRNEAEADVA